ncbi:hypothetical protein P170DRAFT_432608 [Aspergillus steynii IBT 23096]|uniref:Nucleic acid-binding protein n=1 Tax=Aspergillus steynii IBT 23096 TaxID=1392250 RepID=A0A2I2GQC1_9EURO|nr:uncharacterized protein P170DRAFT_432608 [Aspergillus steynii IBT 23096]PLB55070.1 hypothetical protein P170DRAFT_432608 [Aspergillus steynii IBT 23096]
MPRKVIFLMGAPSVQSLRWDEHELLHAPIHPFHGASIGTEGAGSFDEAYPVKWRLLQEPLALPEASPDQDEPDPTRGARFFTIDELATPGDISTTTSDDSTLSKFYNHSFAIHETSEISAPGTSRDDSMRESGLWMDSTSTSIALSWDEETTKPSLPMQGNITDLQDVPSAAYLNGIVPQTMTVNLIVGIIAIRPPRRIVTRQWKRELDLVEVVVGDNTRSGFGVTFWLPRTGRDGGDENELRGRLATLRPRDIVLLGTVGLGAFRERVYGQSLRNGITRVELLHRQRVDATDAGGLYSARKLREAKPDDLPLAKVREVREWIRQFVGPEAAGGGTRGPKQRGPMEDPAKNPHPTILPPDTPS